VAAEVRAVLAFLDVKILAAGTLQIDFISAMMSTDRQLLLVLHRGFTPAEQAGGVS